MVNDPIIETFKLNSVPSKTFLVSWYGIVLPKHGIATYLNFARRFVTDSLDNVGAHCGHGNVRVGNVGNELQNLALIRPAGLRF